MNCRAVTPPVTWTVTILSFPDYGTSVHALLREWHSGCNSLPQVSSVDSQNRNDEHERIGHASLLRVGFNAFEFVLHFEEFDVPGIVTGPLAIGVSPAVAQAFAATLAESLAEYKKRFGKIPEAPK